MRPLGLWILFGFVPTAGFGADLSVAQIVQKSVAANDADWKAAPEYAFEETDFVVSHGRTARKQYEVLMIAGSTYNRLIKVNGEPLPASQERAEAKKLQQEIQRWQHESPDAHRKRVAEYQQERRQDHALMSEIVKAFDFKLAGTETINGHKCYVLEATPKPGYRPPNRDTKALTGMRGKMWIDTQEFQWVKVHAEVFRPVAFGLFIAHVEPGTEFTLEEKPVREGLWLPSHFQTTVKANVLGVWSRNSNDDETYTNYRPMSEAMARVTPSSPSQPPTHR